MIVLEGEFNTECCGILILRHVYFDCDQVDICVVFKSYEVIEVSPVGRSGNEIGEPCIVELYVFL